jgi:hypothetical protein
MKGSTIVAVSYCLIMAACKPARHDENFANGKWIDLTYSFSEQTLYWPNNATGFKLDTLI